MPPAGSSRRLMRRGPSNDDIENEPTQVSRQDPIDEEEEGDERPKKVSKVKAENATVDELQDPETILANLGNQSLDRAGLTKMGGLASDWGQMRKNTHKNAFELIVDVAPSLAEFAEGEEGEQSIAELDAIMRRLVDTEHELIAHEEALNQLREKIATGEEITDVVERYESDAKEQISQYQKKTARQRYAKHETYYKFRHAIFEVQHPETAMPPVTELLPKETGDGSDEDDDIEVGGVTQDYRCPLSLTILVNPLTSTVCNHSFSADAIKEYMGNKRSVQCPAAGCHKMIAWGDLQPNKELAKKARDAARRERAREASDESDADEVVE